MRSSLDQRVKDLESDITGKQDTLVSGTNIKTINGNSLLGSGNISISGATLADGDYGDITVGSSGTTMTIDNLAVTNAKINDVDGSKVTQSASYRLVTDTEKATWNNKLDLNGGNANTDIDIGAYKFNAQSLHVKGTAGAGHLGLKHQSSNITASTNESSLGANSSGNPVWKNDGNAIQNIMLENTAITGATKTKITYDSKGLVTAGADATTADIADSTNKRYVTDAQLTVIGNTSGTNTGDETTATIQTKLGTASSSTSGYLTSTDWNTFNNKQPAGTYATGTGTASGTNTGDETSTTIKTKLGTASAGSDGYLTATDWSTFNGKQAALTNPVTGTGTNNEIAAFNSTGSTITSLTTATYPSLTELSYVKGVTSKIQDQLNAKEPTITNGFGITGTTTKAVSLTNTQAFCTATTAISAATYADITGASITLAAGTWLIMATANVYAANTAFIAHIAITDGANTVIAEGSQGMPASGTASVNQWGNVSLSAIVSPAGSTTYKLRGARGNTTITGTYTVADGAGTGTTNNTTDNTDKGTVIMAVRIA